MTRHFPALLLIAFVGSAGVSYALNEPELGLPSRTVRSIGEQYKQMSTTAEFKAIPISSAVAATSFSPIAKSGV